jgi:predicted DCC family thiol-disulfide oxidoreductase YuxK
MNSSVILFDGICNLCNGFVQFVIKRDRKNVFKFASLQSAYGQKFLTENKLNTDEFKSIILYKNEKLFTQSTAALKIFKELNGLWKLFFAFIVIPKFIRDAVYNLIARNRYRWFGKKETCMVPTKELEEKFLE